MSFSDVQEFSDTTQVTLSSSTNIEPFSDSTFVTTSSSTVVDSVDIDNSKNLEKLLESNNKIIQYMQSQNLTSFESGSSLIPNKDNMSISLSFVDQTSNELVIGLDPKSTGTSDEYLQKIKQIINNDIAIKLQKIKVFRETCTDVDDCDQGMGGIGVGPGTPQNTGTFTIPFVTTAGNVGFVMSGHVAGNGQTGQDIEHSGTIIGTVLTNPSLSNRTSDSAFVESESTLDLIMKIFNHNNPSSHYDVIDVKTSSQTNVSDPVYRSGIAEGERLGGIGAKGVTVTDSIGTLTNQVITTGTISDVGDSGGPYFSPPVNNNVIFYGLHVGWVCVLDFDYDNPDLSITEKSECTLEGGLVSSFYSPWESIQDELNLVDFDEICSPPTTGDWTLNASCTMISDTTIGGDVIVNSPSRLTIPDGVSLDIDFNNNHLLIKSGGSVYLEDGGEIT